MGKKQRKWKEHLVSSMEIPRDLAYRESIIRITGRKQLTIENYKGIQIFSSQQTVVTLNQGKVKILGKDLEIQFYMENEMTVTGFISQVIFEI